MELPEFTLRAGTTRGLGGPRCQRMHGKRKVFVSHGHAITKLFAQPGEIRIYLLAVGALIVGEFDDLHRSTFGTKPGSIPHLDVSARLIQFNHDGIFASQFSDVCVPRFLRTTLVYRIDAVGPRRLIRLVRLYTLVVEAKLVFCRLGYIGRDVTLE